MAPRPSDRHVRIVQERWRHRHANAAFRGVVRAMLSTLRAAHPRKHK